VCVAITLASARVTVTSFDPAFDESIFGGFGRTTRNIEVGVTVENRGPTTMNLTQQNWRLTDGRTTYPFLSTAPNQLYNRSIAAGGKLSGFVTFQEVPRSATSLLLRVTFSEQTVDFRLPSAKTTCAFPP